MVYKCFSCNKRLKAEQIERRIRCDYCGSRIILKERNAVKTIKAR